MRQSEAIFVGVLVVVVAAAAVLIDNLLPSGTRNQTVTQSGPVLSEGWYCPAPPSDEEVQASMATANLGNSELGLRRFAVGGGGQSPVSQSSVEPGFQTVGTVNEFNLNDSTGLVDTFGGHSATDMVALGRGKGAGSTSCSAQPANRWLFASGSTARGENHYLLVANPFREEAVIQVRFIAPDKDVVPARLKDLVIPALTQRWILLADFLAETPSFGLEVTASQGRVVAARYSSVVRGGAEGIAINLGASAPSSDWTFAEGLLPSGGEESIVLVNPGTREALIGVVFMTEGERTAPPALSEVPVPAGRQVTINVGEHLPAGTSHGISIDSTNGEPVVAERRNTAMVDKNSGYETSFGAPAIGLRWSVPVGSPVGGSSRLSIVNPGDGRTTVKVTLYGGAGAVNRSELNSVAVEAGRKLTIDLTEALGGGFYTALVESSREPVAVESTFSLNSPYSDAAYNSGRRL